MYSARRTTLTSSRAASISSRIQNGVVDISTALKLARKYLIRKESNKKLDIISLIAKHVHAVKTEFRQFDRPLRGIGAIHFGYR